MTWPTDKLSLINENLALTGNNLCSVADDGTDEWTVCSAAYEQGLEYMLDNHDWKQITNVKTLVSTGIAPADSEFDTAFAKPDDCIHVIWVRFNDVPVVYQILNNQIVINSGGATGATTVKYVSSGPPGSSTNSETSPAAAQMTRTFMTALKRFVMSGIYRGLNEDLGEASHQENAARQILAEARTRSDQEQPKRAPFNSRMSASRRTRRPFPVVPGGWGGTGSPG